MGMDGRGRSRRPSIGKVGAAHDNALIESWFSSFKNEAIHPYPMPKTRELARKVLFEHVTFHNQRRLHSALGYTTPTIYEQTTVST
jgi:transposase InsO family protein